jgi:hypothetical protein
MQRVKRVYTVHVVSVVGHAPSAMCQSMPVCCCSLTPGVVLLLMLQYVQGRIQHSCCRQQAQVLPQELL